MNSRPDLSRNSESGAGRPVLVFDGDCNFCRYWVARWERATGDSVEYVSARDAVLRFPDLVTEHLSQAVILLEPGGGVRIGAVAVIKALAGSGPAGSILNSAVNIPGFTQAAQWVYRFVAGRRRFFSRLTILLRGPDPSPSSFQIARRALLAGLGLVYLIAFLSLGIQITGLAGEEGILPASGYLQLLEEGMGLERYYQVPSLAWFASSDIALRFFCWVGALVALMLMAGVAPVPCAILLWMLYLSLVVVTRVFLNFQWDVLLLEAGFLAIFLAPVTWFHRLSRASRPSPTVMFLFRWLLFRLMIGSGLVKLGSGDESWWGLTALDVHYETQPIPSWTSWYMHQLPHGFHALSVIVMFVAELAAPCLIFGSRRMRQAAFWILASLQLLIAATGNYAFFNILSAVLCFSLLDDASWPGWIRRRLAIKGGGQPAYRKWRQGRSLIAGFLAVVVVIVSGFGAARRADLIQTVPASVAEAQRWIRPFRILNSYGLFASMTTSRPEIVLEGSADGRLWKPYSFKWKPGDVSRPPGFVAPHQPRLDWQMWFAALGSCNRNPWFVNFMERLLTGSGAVSDLLDENPFPGAPPRHLRALRYDYRFTRIEGGAGDWWTRDLAGLYCPEVMLQNGKIRAR